MVKAKFMRKHGLNMPRVFLSIKGIYQIYLMEVSV